MSQVCAVCSERYVLTHACLGGAVAVGSGIEAWKPGAPSVRLFGVNRDVVPSAFNRVDAERYADMYDADCGDA